MDAIHHIPFIRLTLDQLRPTIRRCIVPIPIIRIKIRTTTFSNLTLRIIIDLVHRIAILFNTSLTVMMTEIYLLSQRLRCSLMVTIKINNLIINCINLCSNILMLNNLIG